MSTAGEGGAGWVRAGDSFKGGNGRAEALSGGGCPSDERGCRSNSDESAMECGQVAGEAGGRRDARTACRGTMQRGNQRVHDAAWESSVMGRVKGSGLISK
jgi:hypothetical protein